jgi:hypothetical protein
MQKNILYLLLVFLLIHFNLYSQYTWPIENSKAGENIIYKPQDLIGNELNFDNLIVGADYGAKVIAPESGEIVNVSYIFNKNLSYVFSKRVDLMNVPDFAGYDIKLRNDFASKFLVDSKYVSLSLIVKTYDGKTYFLSGLRPIVPLKSGSNITKGDIIGKVGYCYGKIPKPAIMFSVSINSKPADPMGVFGLSTTFIPPKSNKNKIDYLSYKHSPKSLQEDFKVFCDALIEGHPGLYDYISKEELNRTMNKTLEELDTSMTSEEFRLKLLRIIALIKDSHTAVYSKRYKLTDGSKPPILFGLNNDTLTIYSSINMYSDFLGKKITSIDGKEINSITPKISSILYRNDGYIKTGKERELFLNYWKYYGEIFSKHKNDTIQLHFTDGTSDFFIYDYYEDSAFYPQVIKPFTDSVKVITKVLESKIGYIRINDFLLNDIEREQIRDFIRHISDSSYKGLIVDVRDNLGGNDEIYPYIAQEPWRKAIEYKVNKKGSYELFKNSINYSEDAELFLDYNLSKNDSSFIIPKDSIALSYPCDSINFKGKVVIIANEFSLSAATLLPALVHKYKRGVVIGRETGSSYYHMNAIVFPKIALNNTGLELFLPLIQIVFTDKEENDIPYGRGVIPDINIPLYYEEFFGDDSRYIEAAIETINEKDNNYYNIIILISISLILISLILFFIRKRK